MWRLKYFVESAAIPQRACIMPSANNIPIPGTSQYSITLERMSPNPIRLCYEPISMTSGGVRYVMAGNTMRFDRLSELSTDTLSIKERIEW